MIAARRLASSASRDTHDTAVPTKASASRASKRRSAAMSRVTSSAASGRKRRSSMKRAAAYFVRFASRNATRLRRADGVERDVDGTPRPHSPRGVRAVTRSWTASCASEATTTVEIVGYSATSVSTAATYKRDG